MNSKNNPETSSASVEHVVMRLLPPGIKLSSCKLSELRTAISGELIELQREIDDWREAAKEWDCETAAQLKDRIMALPETY